MNQYDVIIIGAGPAGIFAARELVEKSSLRILMVEKGKVLEKRKCLADHKNDVSGCLNCKLCSIMCGWGGAGAYSDGKLTLTTEFGGWLTNYIGKKELEEYIAYVDDIYVRHGAPDHLFGKPQEQIDDLKNHLAKANLKLVPARIRHMGSENTLVVLKKFKEALQGSITIKTEEKVEEILVSEQRVCGIKTPKDQYFASKVICAPGRDGAQWFSDQARKLGIKLNNNQVDVGVRVEIPSVTMKELTDLVYEPKIFFYTRCFDDVVRTFCVNPNGIVVMENTNGVITVNGHAFANSKTANTNFALLLSQEFTEPFDQPILYGRSIASLANMLSGGIIVQRYGDLKRGRRSTYSRLEKGIVEPTLKTAVPGDLSLVLPHRYMVGIQETLEALDLAIPGIASDHTLLYGIEAKFYSARPKLSNSLETSIKGLWAIGDGAGVTRGLIQSSVSGVIAARDILARAL